MDTKDEIEEILNKRQQIYFLGVSHGNGGRCDRHWKNYWAWMYLRNLSGIYPHIKLNQCIKWLKNNGRHRRNTH